MRIGLKIDDVSRIDDVSMLQELMMLQELNILKELNLPHSEIIDETLASLDGNNLDENKLIMISKYPLCRIYIFTREDDGFIHKSTIKVETYGEKIFLSNGKLFIYDEKLGSITKWDIKTSKFEAFFLFNNSFKVDNMKLSDNGVLLFVYGRKREDNLHKDHYPCISIYFTDNGNKFTTFHHNNTVKKQHEKKYKYDICDPFAPYIPGKSYVKANDLFKDFEAKCDEVFGNKYIIKNDKIVGFNHDGKLEYSKKFFVTWTLTYEYMNVILTAKFKNDKIEQPYKSDSIQIIPELYLKSDKDSKEFVNICDCLDDDNFVMVTYWGIFVWTFNTKIYKIELNHCWEDEGDLGLGKKKSY
ncbi:hypothetical protein F8M41_005405 [Gigaspora margarita]|uniref:Uncharacterized protein n=1 Tax=Gigaspora margarita TaxID=4874 RepID=A0A8H3XB80_GIGMA|nr:hypothetical protein F8M41_005405 [Gigaspora margarita]